MNQLKTDFLCASSSFLMGVGSVLNLGGHTHIYNTCDTPDEIAIANDWRMVGQDIREALVKSKIEATSNVQGEHERKQAT